MVPQDNSHLARKIREIEVENNKRHDQNLQRFAKLEAAAAKIQGEMRIIIALLVTNGSLQLVQVLQTRK